MGAAQEQTTDPVAVARARAQALLSLDQQQLLQASAKTAMPCKCCVGRKERKRTDKCKCLDCLGCDFECCECPDDKVKPAKIESTVPPGTVGHILPSPQAQILSPLPVIQPLNQYQPRVLYYPAQVQFAPAFGGACVGGR